jgi:beta-N-acetylhexosaminidase
VSHADETGRLIAAGIPGPTLDAAARRTLERVHPGVVVLFRRNVVDPEQLRALVADLHQLAAPPLVAIDHEGGRVTRLAAPFTAFPSAAEIGRAGVAAARAVGEAVGRELASVGIDVDFAPVLDVGDAAGASILGSRAFGSDPAVVAETGAAFAAGLLAAGVLPCGKQFPGHGATSDDSHLTRPVVTRSRAELAAVDLVPFRAAIGVGVPMLMTAHVLYPALDAHRIATLSPAIVGDLLRRDLRFDGVLWSDDLLMQSVASELPPADAAVAAIAAGVDGVLICHDLTEARLAAERLQAAVGSSALPAARMRQALDRMAALHARRPARPAPLALPAAAHVALADEVRRVAAAQRA